MGEIQIIEGVKGRLNENGFVELNLEHIARGLGFTQKKNNVEYVRWETVNGYLNEFGVSQQVGKDDFIAENLFYKLCFKAKNEIARAFQDLVTDVILPTIRKTGSYNSKPQIEEKLKIQEMNAKTRMANMYLKLSKVETLSKEYKNILVVKAAEVLSSGGLLPLPKSEQKTYSATEVGEKLGVSSNKIGKIANTHNLKTQEYGEWYRSKSEHCSKEVDTFRYYDTAIPKFKEILNSKLIIV